MTDVGGEEDAGDVSCVSHELADGEDRGGIAALNHTPNVDVALTCGVSKGLTLSSGQTHGVVACADHASITCNCDTSHADVVLWNELVRALILSQVPDPHVTTAIAADELSLIWMNDYIVDRNTMSVVALNVA